MTSRHPGLRLDALLSTASEPVFLLDSDRRFVGVNPAFEALVGHSADRIVGLVCHPHGPTRAGDLAGLGGSFYPPAETLAGQPSGGTTLILHAEGERRWRRVEFWPFHDADGSLLAIFGFVRPTEATPLAPNSESQRLRLELMEVRARMDQRFGFDSLIGRGPAHRRILGQIQAAAASSVSVLIVGEPGSGKRTIARTIHALSARKVSSITPFDAMALPPEVLARELFGIHDDDNRDGHLRKDSSGSPLTLPDNSTLLIAHILELPRDLQDRLASVLDGRVRLIGSTVDEPDLALQTDRLHPNLYYALTSLLIRPLPLRERIDELPLLAQHLLERANQRGGRQREAFMPEAIEALIAYDWPGNLRELARVIDAAQVVGSDPRIRVEDLPVGIRGHLGGAYLPPPLESLPPLDERLTQIERRLIEQSLIRARQNKSRAAELLGISRPRLYRRIKELGIEDKADETPQ